MTPGAELLADHPVELPLVDARTPFRGSVFDVRTETVDLGAAGPVTRDYVRHPGAVAVMAVDDRDRLLLVRQYRHPVRAMLWEPPAGLCDVAGERLEETAHRELWEETGYVASALDPLLDVLLSPGGSSERLVIFVARGLRKSADQAHPSSGEELEMQVKWWPIPEVLSAVMGGRVRNPSLVLGTLALAQSRRDHD